MGNYTVYHNGGIDLFIEKQLNNIVNEILSIINPNELKAIILGGGFGRGEGGVWLRNGQIFPVNDFDITVFPKNNFKIFKQIHLKNLQNLAATLAPSIPIKQIDINVGNWWKFNVRCYSWFYTINAHDFIHGHIPIYGSINLDRLKKHYTSKKIPRIEGLKFLYTRGSGLVFALYAQIMRREIPEEIIYMDINKMHIALGDSYLVLRKLYNSSYSKRISIASTIDFDFDEGYIIKEMYLNALKWKIRPTEVDITSDIKSHCEQLSIQFLKFFLYFENIRLGQQFDGIMEYIIYISRKRRTLIESISKSDYFISKMIIMLLLLANRFNAYDKNIEAELDIRMQYFGIDENMTTWDQYAINFLKIFHPEGIVNEVIEKS